MKLVTSDLVAETERWGLSDSDLNKRARSMSQMAYSMYQFTRGEGDLKTTQVKWLLIKKFQLHIVAIKIVFYVFIPINFTMHSYLLMRNI